MVAPSDKSVAAEAEPPPAHGRRGEADVAVLGAGVAGLAAAHELSGRGLRVVVIDRLPACGGTHRSWERNGRSYDVGSIFFEPNHPLFEMVEGLKEHFVPVVRRQQRVTLGGKLSHYPFEPSEVFSWPLSLQLHAVGSLLYHRLVAKGGEDVESQSRAHLGKVIFEQSGLACYVARFHRVEPREIGSLFFEKRMAHLRRSTSWSGMARMASRMLFGQRTRRRVPAPLLVRPANGFGPVYEAVQKSLADRGVEFALGSPVTGLQRTGDGYEVRAGEKMVPARNIVSTMPIDLVHRIVHGTGSGLESIDLLTLFVRFVGNCRFHAHVLFNFHSHGDWKRLTMYSRIYGAQPGLHHFAVEITQREGEHLDPEEAYRSFARHVQDLGLFDGPMALEGHTIVTGAYPLYRPNSAAHIEKVVKSLEAKGIHSAGRQGRFDYLPVSAQVIRKTRETLRNSSFA